MRRGPVAAVLVVVLLVPPAAAAAGDGIQTIGNVFNIALPLTALGATVGRHDWTGTGQFALSYGVTFGTTFVLKRTVNETRPDGGKYSFPSGHSSSTFASAEFLRRRYGWAWGAPAYALAAFVAFSRVESRRHYAHDVVAGAAIGIASSLIFTRPPRKWTAAASGDSRGAQISVSRVW